jgi:hypothetical protein
MKRLYKLTVVAILAPLLFAFGPTDRLCWDANTESDLAGYRVHSGSAPRAYTQVMDVQLTPTPAAPCVTLGSLGLQGGSYYVAVTAYDVESLESEYSNEVTFPLDLTEGVPPAAPGGVRIQGP